MTRARAGSGKSSKSAVFGKGTYDGTRRNYFFQRVEPDPREPRGSLGVCQATPRSAASPLRPNPLRPTRPITAPSRAFSPPRQPLPARLASSIWHPPVTLVAEAKVSKTKPPAQFACRRPQPNEPKAGLKVGGWPKIAHDQTNPTKIPPAAGCKPGTPNQDPSESIWYPEGRKAFAS